jgi:protein required for attachment to host cells
MDLRTRLADLSRLRSPASPVVTVYLGIRWTDEHERERVRVFLKNEVRRAREAEADEADLGWVEAQGEAIVGEGRLHEAQGVALFACRALGLREVIPLRVAPDPALVVGPGPFLEPLLAAIGAAPAALVAFVDGESARLVPLGPGGVGDEVVLESDVPGHHRRGGWAQLAQSRYQRHIEDHRGRHFEAVAEALAQLVGDTGVERVVLAGEPRTLATFRRHLPAPLSARIVGGVTGTRHEPARALADRASELITRVEAEVAASAIEAVITEAAKGGQAVTGLEPTLEAAARGAVARLFLNRGLREAGRWCAQCGRLQRGAEGRCQGCGGGTREVDLAGALADRVVSTGGTVTVMDHHPGLAARGGVGARLRYPL